MEFSRFLATPHEAIAIFSLQAKPARNRVFSLLHQKLGENRGPTSFHNRLTHKSEILSGRYIIAIAALHGPRHDPRAPKMRRWTTVPGTQLKSIWNHSPPIELH